MIIDRTDLEYIRNIKAYYKIKERYCLLYTNFEFSQLYKLAPDLMRTGIELKIKNKECLSSMNLNGIFVCERDDTERIQQKISMCEFIDPGDISYKNIFLVSIYYNKYTNYIVFTDMYNFLNNKLKNRELYQYVSGLFTIVFSDEKSAHSRSAISSVFQLGNGDCAYFLPIVNRLYSKAKEEKKEFFIISFDKLHTEVAKMFFKDAIYMEIYNCIELSQYYIDVLLTSGQYGEVYAQMFSGNLGTNIFEYLIEHYSLGTPDEIYEDFQKLVVSLPKSSYEIMINSLREKYRYVIGIQRISGSSIVNEIAVKEWPIAQAQQFIDICVSNSICVINLEPYMKTDINNVVDLSDCTVWDLYSLIAELDAVVGVDSFCGHIAGIMGIPNITLFGSSKEIYNVQSDSFRPIANNFSIYPLEYDIERIKARLVFEKLVKILHDSLREKVYKRYALQVENIDYEWV